MKIYCPQVGLVADEDIELTAVYDLDDDEDEDEDEDDEGKDRKYHNDRKKNRQD